jgi:dTDP-4-amino-4,6-dideoxygalactose transaminase
LSKIKNPIFELPKTAPHNNHVYHLFVIKTSKRDELIKYLESHNIKTQIHYPIPPHLEDRYQSLMHSLGEYPITEEVSQRILSLPLYLGITLSNLLIIADALEGFK